MHAILRQRLKDTLEESRMKRVSVQIATADCTLQSARLGRSKGNPVGCSSGM